MTTVTILPECCNTEPTRYRAVGRGRQSVGNTAGEALDALTAQLSKEERGTLLVVQKMQPDAFFTAAQQQRLAELMDRWRSSREQGGTLSAAEQAELDALAATELEAATRRAAALVQALHP